MQITLSKVEPLIAVFFVFSMSLITSCSHSLKTTYSSLTATEQLLITRSLERSVAQLNLEKFGGKET